MSLASTHPTYRARTLARVLLPFVLAVVFVLAATALRWLLDPLIEDKYAWSFYYLPVLAVTGYWGLPAGVVALLLGAVAGIVPFIPAENALALHPADIAGLTIYLVVGSVVMWVAARLHRELGAMAERRQVLEREIAQRRQAERDKQRLNDELRRRIQEFDVLWEKTEVGIAFARDSECRVVLANPALRRMLQVNDARNVSLAKENRANLPFHAMRGGRELAADELPLQRAARTGKPVLDEEIELRRADGSTLITLVSATPLFDRDGKVYGCFATLVDITERKRFEEALRRGEARERARAQEIAAVMEAVPAVVFLADDPECRMIRTNRVGRELLRMPEGANVSKSAPEGPTEFRVLQGGRELAPDQLPVQRAARGETIENFEEDVVFDDGTVRHLLGNAVPLYDEDGRPRGAVAAFIDITERQRAEDALRMADQRKDEFLATLGHQLRNTLAPIKSGIDIIRKHLNDERRRAWAIEVVDRQLHQLSRIVDDLLELARVATGRVALQREPTPLPALVSQAVETVRPLIARKGQRLHVELPPEPVVLDVDGARLVQVLTNLLDNASRHTPRGGMIAIGAVVRGEHVQLRVRDSGDGIDPRELPRVFEMFRRVGQANGHGGLGVGLAFARRIVELHGGTISAHSPGLNRGSEFRIELPLTAGALIARDEPPPVRRRASAPRRILMIDDNRDAVDSMAELLRIHGHEVRCIYTSNEALRGALEFEPDVIMLDIDMVDASGYQIAQEFRSNQKLRGLPLVAVTGYGRAADKEQALHAGFDAHFTKPARMEELLDYLASLPPRRAELDAAAEHAGVR